MGRSGERERDGRDGGAVSFCARGDDPEVGPALGADVTLVSVTKGIEGDSLKTMIAMLAEVAPAVKRLAVLSGPSFAAEVARGKPAAVVAAARDEAVSRSVQQLFASHTLRVYRSVDVDGVELAGAAKNVIAIAAGVSDGLGLGSSARAALITRGLAELTRLGLRAWRTRRNNLWARGIGRSRSDLHRRPFAQPRAGPQDWPERKRRGHRCERAPGTSGGRRCLQRSFDKHAGRADGRGDAYRSGGLPGAHEGAPANAMVDELLSRELKAEF